MKHRSIVALVLGTFAAVSLAFGCFASAADDDAVPQPSELPLPTSDPVTTTNPSGDSKPPYYVYSVRNDEVAVGRHDVPCHAKLGDTIWVDVVEVDKWFGDPEVKRKLGSSSPSVSDVVLTFNGLWLPDVHPEYWYHDTDAKLGEITHLRFVLSQGDDSKKSWARLLSQPVLSRQLQVSVAFPTTDEIPTFVEQNATSKRQQFFLDVLPKAGLLMSSLVLGVSFLLFCWLARATDLVRDSTAPRRPDGRFPYSLARWQMAFWFFLVIISYMLLWIITGDKDTITGSVLALIGISAGTALSAAIVDSGKQPLGDAKPASVSKVDLSQSRQKIVADLKQLRNAASTQLQSVQHARISIPSWDKFKLEENQAAQESTRREIEDLDRQADYFTWPAWKGAMYDLLGENNVITFHRFQIFVWTIVLGIIFCYDVYRYLAMPTFSGTLLGLLGISAGTYVGFKFPEQR